MKEKLVILGATEYVNPLIEKAQTLGYETHVFAWETGDIGEKTADYFYPISLRNKEEVLKKCREIHPCGVVTLGSDLAAATAAYVTESLELPGNKYEDVLRTVNKIRFRQMMQQNNILQPNFVGVGDKYSVESSRKITFPVVVKPSDRSASRGVKKSQHVRKCSGQLLKQENCQTKAK